jgi:Pyridoxamine 5'-phosphate oxidase
MPTEAPRQHASTTPTQPQLPEPTHAERTRTLLSLVNTGMLSTTSRKHPGFPFGSLMPFALDPAGRPLFLISNMAMHTHNLPADPHRSPFVLQDAQGTMGPSVDIPCNLRESEPQKPVKPPHLWMYAQPSESNRDEISKMLAYSQPQLPIIEIGASESDTP